MDHTNTYDPAAGQHSFMNHTGHMMLPSGAAYGSAQPERGAMRTLFGDLDRSAGPMLDGGSGGPLRGLYPSPPFACRPADRGFYPYPSYLPQQYGPRVPTPFPGPRQPRPDPGARAESDAAAQRRRDVQWVEAFTRDRPHHHPLSSGGPGKSPGPDLKLMVCRAAQLIDQLEGLCGDLRTHVGDPGVWTDAHVRAMDVRKELEDAFAAIDGVDVDAWKTKMRRRSGRRTRKHRLEAERRRRERISEKEAAIDAWRLRHIRGVEEKKKERELKLVADAVLCEVRKKQADVKRMQDILRSLQKLHKLRKEAALRKGIAIERKCEEAFSGRLDQLNSVLKVRTSVYATEEKALKVMIEGEHEEEKRRDREKQLKKEKEKFLLRKRMVDAVLFGEFTADAAPQPFMDYYTQAECSVHALLQIRSEWDMFVVAADHPDGSSIPQNWIVPDQPTDEAWASALQMTGYG